MSSDNQPKPGSNSPQVLLFTTEEGGRIFSWPHIVRLEVAEQAVSSSNRRGAAELVSKETCIKIVDVHHRTYPLTSWQAPADTLWLLDQIGQVIATGRSVSIPTMISALRAKRVSQNEQAKDE